MKKWSEWMLVREAMSPEQIKAAQQRIGRTNIMNPGKPAPQPAGQPVADKNANLRNVQMLLRGEPGMTLGRLKEFGRSGSYDIWDFIRFGYREGFDDNTSVTAIVGPYKQYA